MQNRRQGRFGFNVWVALLGQRVLAYEIYNENLNSKGYLRILEEDIFSFMENIPLLENRALYYQQDGAPAHDTAEISEHLSRNFGNKWIGNRAPIRWPARSPD